MPLQSIARQFSCSVINIEPLGNGHINDTYKVETNNKPFVLQKINRHVFPRPELIMENLSVLSQHVEQKGHLYLPTLQIPKIWMTLNGDNHYLDSQGDYWRAISYIANSQCFETLVSLGQAAKVGLALAQFHRLTYTLDVNVLHDTLPGFHITPSYYQQYREVLTQTQIKQDDYCADFIEHFGDNIHDLEHAKAQGLLTEKVIHGDPKLNNFLFDKNTRRIISLIDLDTVKPGLIHYDIGDCLRSCCHRLEDDSFDLKTCRIILKAYLIVMKKWLAANDIDYLYPSIRLIPFELGLRFYTDYLAGNRYFKVAKPEENLHRAQAQFRLCASIIRQEDDILRVIEERKS